MTMSLKYFLLVFVLIRHSFSLKSSDFCFIKDSECLGAYDSSVATHPFKCSVLEHGQDVIFCAINEAHCKQLKHLKHEVRALGSLRHRLAVQSIYKMRAHTLKSIRMNIKACLLYQPEWNRSDMCLNSENKCQEKCMHSYT